MYLLFSVVQFMLTEGECPNISAFLIEYLKLYDFEAILAIRTWAVWNRSKSIGIGLVALLIASLVLQCIFAHIFVLSIECMSVYIGCDYPTKKCSVDRSPPYLGFRRCFITNADRIVWVCYSSATIVRACPFF